ncbi:unnamed protein product [Parascedosporium putredinis]|uniref:Uncharacterized protein n=1 Tax=Parascedosporium putredinis TaxID=1442378 RepID=A0A9P1GY29_9PEZI|nr:unnamed protein product [Parascedosporium putredinis]CAI7990353.1 unnamed protein product [Parascedosporium putredinis]
MQSRIAYRDPVGPPFTFPQDFETPITQNAQPPDSFLRQRQHSTQGPKNVQGRYSSTRHHGQSTFACEMELEFNPPQHQLRRKTPSGTITDGYDGSLAPSIPGPPPLKQLIVPGSSFGTLAIRESVSTATGSPVSKEHMRTDLDHVQSHNLRDPHARLHTRSSPNHNKTVTTFSSSIYSLPHTPQAPMLMGISKTGRTRPSDAGIPGGPAHVNTFQYSKEIRRGGLSYPLPHGVSRSPSFFSFAGHNALSNFQDAPLLSTHLKLATLSLSPRGRIVYEHIGPKSRSIPSEDLD